MKLIEKNFILIDTLLYFFSKLLPALLNLAFISVFIGIVGLDGYGEFSLNIYLINLIVSFSFGWLNQSILRYSSLGVSRNVQPPILQMIFSSLIIALFTNIIITYATKASTAFAITSFAIICIGFFTVLKTIYQSNLNPKKIIKLTTLQALLFFLTPLFLSLYFILDFKILIFTTGLSFLIPSLLLIKKKEIFFFNSQMKIDKSLIKRWIKFGIPLSVWSSLGLLLSFLDRYFINKYYNLESLGIYSSLSELSIKIFSLFIFPFTLAIHPRITKKWNENKKNDAIELIKLSIMAVVVVLLLSTFFLLKFDKELFKIITIFIPIKGLENANLLFPLFITGIIWQLSFFTQKLIELKENTYLMIIFIFISVLINIAGNTIYLPKYGIIATSYASMISSLSYCFLTFVYFLLKKNTEH